MKNYSDTPLIIEKIWLEIFTDSHNINLNSDGTSSDVKKGSTVAPHNVIEGDVCFNLGKQTYNSIAVNEYRVHLKDVTGYEKEIIEILVNEA